MGAPARFTSWPFCFGRRCHALHTGLWKGFRCDGSTGLLRERSTRLTPRSRTNAHNAQHYVLSRVG